MSKKDWIEIAVLIVVIILIRTFIITPAKVNGPSMEGTLHDQSIIVVNKVDYSLNKASRFEIVTIILDNKERLIKRVIGLPGEKIEYKDNKLYINDEEVETPKEFPDTNDFVYEHLNEDEYFVLGDNRNNSTDSRVLGPINEKNIYGTVHFVLYPFSRFGKVK